MTHKKVIKTTIYADDQIIIIQYEGDLQIAMLQLEKCKWMNLTFRIKH
jgi:hypothetical protein